MQKATQEKQQITYEGILHKVISWIPQQNCVSQKGMAGYI